MFSALFIISINPLQKCPLEFSDNREISISLVGLYHLNLIKYILLFIGFNLLSTSEHWGESSRGTVEGCHKEVRDKTGHVGNTMSCSIVRGNKRSVGGRGDMGGKGDQKSISSWEGRSLSKGNAILRRPPGPSRPKVGMFNVHTYCEVDCCDKFASLHCNRWRGRL